MDTWATSSLTPQIVTGWVDDPDLFERTFPMDLRPQGPEIIRTWLFDTVVRARFEHGVLPWSDTTINGWVLDPDRKKMSKSKGNVVTPMPLVEEYGPDALRYWACNGRPAVDTAVDYGIMKIGRKLAIKILNASKFTLNIVDDVLGDDVGSRRRSRARSPTRSTGRCSRRSPTSSTTRPTAFDAFDYARALERIERFFWSFCDDYVELVKGRAYGGGRRSGSGVGRGRAAHRALDAAARCSRRSCRSSPKRCGRGSRRDRFTAPRGPTGERAPARRRRPARVRGGRRGARRGAQGEVGAEALAA